jgi:hypothetical protein
MKRFAVDATARAAERDVHGGKRPKLEEPATVSAGDIPDHVLLSCFDEPERLVEVSTRLLSSFNCRLYACIKHDDPCVQRATGALFWRCSMTRAMLSTFVRSLTHGELSIGRGVSVSEALTTFEYENVPIGVPPDKSGETKLMRMPPAGVAFEKNTSNTTDVVVRTSEQIAHAIAKWPRLEANLGAALAGMPSNLSCTATRAWVRFCKKPLLFFDNSETMMAVARKWPSWCSLLVAAFGVVHASLVKRGAVEEKARDAAAFNVLQTAIYAQPLGFFFAAIQDWPRWAIDGAARKDTAKGERFAAEMRTVVMEAAAFPGDKSKDVLYARSCISLADALVHDAPSPAVMYSGSCCDDNGKSTERAQLAKSLANRGIKLVRWSDDEKLPQKPLIFPPSWSDGPGSGSNHCAMLLDFSERAR